MTRGFSRASLDPSFSGHSLRCQTGGGGGHCWSDGQMVDCSPSLLCLAQPGLLRLLCLTRSHLPTLDLCGGRPGGQSPPSAAVQPGCRPTGSREGEAHPPTGPARPPPPLPYFSPDNRSANLSPVTETPPPLAAGLSALPASKAPFLSSAVDCS